LDLDLQYSQQERYLSTRSTKRIIVAKGPQDIYHYLNVLHSHPITCKQRKKNFKRSCIKGQLLPLKNQITSFMSIWHAFDSSYRKNPYP